MSMSRSVLQFDYRAFGALVAPARERNELWRLGLGIALALSVAWCGHALTWTVLALTLDTSQFIALARDQYTLLRPESMLLVLFSFAWMLIGIAFSLVLLHKRPLSTVIGLPQLAWYQTKRTMGAMVLLFAAVWALPPHFSAAELQSGLEPTTWLKLLGPALAGVLIQTSTEEIFFRGYLQQQLAARFRHPLIWMVLPSCIFGLGHYAPGTYGANEWIVVLWATVFGLAAADLTARAGTLGPAIALHFVSNVSAIILVSPNGEMSGLALYLYSFDTQNAEALRSFLPIDFAMILLCWLCARIALRR